MDCLCLSCHAAVEGFSFCKEAPAEWPFSKRCSPILMKCLCGKEQRPADAEPFAVAGAVLHIC